MSDYLTGVMIYPHAFRGCMSLRKIDLRFAGKPRSSNGDVFVDCPNLEEVILRADIEDVHMNLGGRTFPSIRKITLENKASVYKQRECHSGRMAFFPEEYKTAVVIVPDGWKYNYSQVFPWSEFTNMITKSEAAGLDAIPVQRELVRVESGILTLMNHDLDVSVYDTTGRNVCVLSAANPSFRPDSSGLYMLYSSAGSQKVLIQ